MAGNSNIIFNRLKIDAKQIRFAAATLQVYGMNSYCGLSVAWSWLLHNDEFIQKLADSRPIRLAAKYTVGIFHRFNAGEIGDILGKLQKMAENATKNTQSSNSTPPKQIGFTETFKRELREGFKELEKRLKNNRQECRKEKRNAIFL